MSWVRLDPDFWDNAKVVAAGLDGAVLFQEVLALNERGSRDGTLTAAESAPEFLGRRMRSSFGWDVTRCVTARHAMRHARLVTELEDGRLRISGWDDQWRPPLTEAERARNYRNRKKEDQRHESSHQASRRASHPASQPLSHPRPSVRPSDQPSNRPSSGGGQGEDGPIEDDLRGRGIRDPKRLATCVLNVSAYDQPRAVVELCAKIAQRHGDDVPALLSHILNDPQQIALALREAADKAQTSEAAQAVRDLIGSLTAKTRAT